MKTKITSNVLEDVARIISGEGNKNHRKKALVVLNGSNVELYKKLEKLKEIKNKGIEISLAFSFMAEKLLYKEKITNSLFPSHTYGEEDIFKLKEITRDYDLIIDPNITVNTLSKVSLGMVDSFISTLIWTFLYKNKSVYIDFYSVRNYLGEKTNNKEIKSLIEKNISTIRKMGAIEIEENSYLEKINGLNNSVEKPFNISKEARRKGVVTQSDILGLETKDLILEKGTIITPLAWDKAREMKINIEIK